MSHRIASLDFLRGISAFAVMIPHALMIRGVGVGAETISILGVEIFFVLSGYVLAPQIISVVEHGGLQNLGIFLVRRWMRTVPPYLIALIITSITAHELFTADFARYAFYVQNLFSKANTNDYFSIAWSLSVEEWFYITFPPFLLIFRRSVIPASIAFIVTITIARFAFADWGHWGEGVRRVVVYRVDSIAWGFLLYIATRGRVMTRLYSSIALIIISAAAIVATYRLASCGKLLEFSFHIYASLLGSVFILAARTWSKTLNEHPSLANVGLFLGRISYSVYLFHLLSISAIARPLATASTPVFLMTAVALTTAIAALMATAIEAPILSARPSYRKSGIEGNNSVLREDVSAARRSTRLPVGDKRGRAGFLATFK